MECTRQISWNGRELTVRAGGALGCEDGLVYVRPLVVLSIEAEWDAADLYYQFLNDDDFGDVTDGEGNVVGIPCPKCGAPMLYEDLQASADVWGVGCNAFIACPHADWAGLTRLPGPTCNTIVFVDDVPEAYGAALLSAEVDATRRRIQDLDRRLTALEGVLKQLGASS